MDEPKRLFDCLAYQLAHGPLEDMLCAKENGQWKKYGTAEVIGLVNQLSAGLLRRGISAGDGTAEGRDKIAIISANRPEWMLADLAIQQTGAVSVPIYPTIHATELGFILRDAAVKMVLVGDQGLYRKVTALRDDLPALEHVFSFAPVPGAPHWRELLADVTPDVARQLDELRGDVRETDLATILYTSGTTGTPKGVMLSHRNILSNVFSSAYLFGEIGVRGRRALSFLPLNHAFERTATYCYFYCGVSVYYAESVATIRENMVEIQPTVCTTVPRLLEKIYEGIMAKGAKLTGVQRRIFLRAVALAERFEINKPLSPVYRLQLALADRLVFRKWREALGGNLRAIITGAAACQVKLLRIFTAGGIVVMEGYGLTETSPVISGNRYTEKNRMFGTVGPLLKDVEVQFGADGEILCKGPNVMMGYYRRPDLTAEVMSGEWLHTGDIGKLVDGKFLKITDRKKELFKTSGGKYVAPQPIENTMVESRWIEQIMVVGESQKYVGALIVPAFNVLKEWYNKQNKAYPGDQAAIATQQVRHFIAEAINGYNKHFNPVEQVKKFELLPREWTVEGGELTPTLKLKRRVIMDKYRDLVARMYASG
jgi:long-chain acyl-CoA synthetase